MGGARNLRCPDQHRADPGGVTILGEFAGEALGDGNRTGCVAGRKAAVRLVPAPTRSRLALAPACRRPRADAIDAALDDFLDRGRQFVGKQHANPGAGQAARSQCQPGSGQSKRQGPQFGLVAEAPDTVDDPAGRAVPPLGKPIGQAGFG